MNFYILHQENENWQYNNAPGFCTPQSDSPCRRLLEFFIGDIVVLCKIIVITLSSDWTKNHSYSIFCSPGYIFEPVDQIHPEAPCMDVNLMFLTAWYECPSYYGNMWLPSSDHCRYCNFLYFHMFSILQDQITDHFCCIIYSHVISFLHVCIQVLCKNLESLGIMFGKIGKNKNPKDSTKVRI